MSLDKGKLNFDIRIVLLILLSVLSIIRLHNEGKCYPTGDAVEYTIMTEALYNHFSPDIRSIDFDSFKKAYCKTNKWEENDKAGVYDAAQKFIAETNHKNLEYSFAFFVDKGGKKYSCHFFFYSLMNLPARALCSIVVFNPLLTHQITNVFLILLTCFFFFKYSLFGKIHTSFFVMMFFYSTNYWYVSWQHPEVFTVCFSSLGLWLFLSEKRFVGLFLISIAAFQNQPISIIIFCLAIYAIYREGINIKNIFKLGGSTFLVVAPSLFYYNHFCETNLIKYQGALSFDNVSFTRVWGFFFDINQGVILAIPLILFVYIFLLIRKLVKFKSEKPILEIILIPSIIVSVTIAGTIDNWNHGQSVVNRYVTYVSGIILVHFIYLLFELKSEKAKKTILISALLTQLATVYYHASLSKFDWSTNLPKPISNWVLENYPQMYNPDPIIFLNRYNPKAALDYSLSPVYYMRANGEITKLLVHEKYLDNLQTLGLSKKQIDSILPTLNFTNKWAYIDVGGELKKSLSTTKLKQMDDERRIKDQIEIIKGTPDWNDAIKKKAAEKGLEEDVMLREDAAFVLHIVLPKTKKEKINETIEKIKRTPSWLKLVEEKSKQYNITLDSALYSDATWAVEEEMRK